MRLHRHQQHLLGLQQAGRAAANGLIARKKCVDRVRELVRTRRVWEHEQSPEISGRTCREMSSSLEPKSMDTSASSWVCESHTGVSRHDAAVLRLVDDGLVADGRYKAPLTSFCDRRAEVRQSASVALDSYLQRHASREEEKQRGLSIFALHKAREELHVHLLRPKSHEDARERHETKRGRTCCRRLSPSSSSQACCSTSFFSPKRFVR